MSKLISVTDCTAQLAAEGFAFVDGERMNTWLGNVSTSANWRAFAGSWNDLVADAYLAEHGTFRRRRHAAFSLSNNGDVTREAHRPHYQSKTYNTLQGGIERWFEPIAREISESPIFRSVLALCARVFGAIAPNVEAWNVETHQFRIESKKDQAGFPTPEGVHRDGVDFVLVVLINRSNIDSGTTTIHDAASRQLGSFTLKRALDSAFVDDSRVFHGVTSVSAIDGNLPAFRDVLVVTLKAK